MVSFFNQWKNKILIVSKAEHLFKKIRLNSIRRTLHQSMIKWATTASVLTKVDTFLKLFSTKYSKKQNKHLIRHQFLIWRCNIENILRMKKVLLNWVNGRENATLRRILSNWNRFASTQKMLIKWGIPVLRRYIYKMDVDALRSSIQLWKCSVLKIKQHDTYMTSIKSCARMVYNVYRRRQILDPMQMYWNQWYLYTHERWPRIVKRTIIAFRRSISNELVEALVKWKLFINERKIKLVLKEEYTNNINKIRRESILLNRKAIAKRYILKWISKNVLYAFNKWNMNIKFIMKNKVEFQNKKNILEKQLLMKQNAYEERKRNIYDVLHLQ